MDELGFTHQEVAGLVDRLLKVALDEYRPDPDRAAAFEAGFSAGAVALWDEVAFALRRRRAALKGSRSAADQRPSPEPDAAVLAAAAAYRNAYPEASEREVAANVARKLRLSPEAVRHQLRKKVVKS